MADLRDQLLKAGLVDKRAKQQADTAARRKKKRKKKKKKGQAQTEEQRRQQAYDERIEAEAAENRRREEQRRADREAAELRHRVADLAGAWAVRERRPGRRRFCFVNRANKVLWFDVGAEVAWKLELGQLAVVEQPGNADEPHVLVPARIAARIAELDPDSVRFWNTEPATDVADGS